MNETFEYEWTPKLGKASLDAYFRTLEGRPWLMLAGGLFSFSAGFYFLFADPEEPWGVVCIIFGTVFILRPVKMFFYKKRLCKDSVRLAPTSKVAVVITEDHLAITSSESNRTIKWDSFTKTKLIDGFLMCFSGKILAASIPLSILDEKHIEYIKKKIPR
ncbi:hypothetical protein P3T73_07340 [Kiritimatiellota bacterium B12222]|nr:hypothetical protein P3T73_10015 [Kiritimatiellota bacterium B12222]WFB37572.1 hypothetical protein P3T73_07340 [Kiritimatiellota bacterium B12222]